MPYLGYATSNMRRRNLRHNNKYKQTVVNFVLFENKKKIKKNNLEEAFRYW
jgi:hypothetical protein